MRTPDASNWVRSSRSAARDDMAAAGGRRPRARPPAPPPVAAHADRHRRENTPGKARRAMQAMTGFIRPPNSRIKSTNRDLNSPLGINHRFRMDSVICGHKISRHVKRIFRLNFLSGNAINLTPDALLS
ncbi:hypothetical protein GSH05_18775 [Burkholderia pseudomallei]|nr:hypothetical protein F5D26_26395 [Burkholderia pseudomallei]MBM5653637.1 hypothetical protein [Burkholderia pseudomallei]